jgi:serine/threonine protein kinase HipA of HipAB toxin-antitoxin module
MTADPSFNLIGVVYPYVARRLLTDPSPRLRKALHEFVIDDGGLPRWDLIDTLLRDASLLGGGVAAVSVGGNSATGALLYAYTISVPFT